MDNRILLQPAYVLHRQPFQNTSLILDFFSLDFGRVKAVAKGARREKSKYRSYIHPFQPLLISFSGRGEVKTLTDVEASVGALELKGPRLFSAMYINELLTRLLHTHVEHKSLYKLYQDALISLQGSDSIELVLRQFELNLLSEIGYGINLENECETNLSIEEGQKYHFVVGVGFVRVTDSMEKQGSKTLFKGQDLIALRSFDFSNQETAQTAKVLLRMALAAHLGEKPIASRALFGRLAT